MNIDSIRRRLLVKYPFFGSVVANSSFIPEQSIPTAATDGKNIYFNPDFIDSISNDQQTFIFAHEVCHIAFDHIYRSEGKDKKIWNIATDSVINAFLKEDGLPIVEGGVDIPEAVNYDAEEMYEKLLKEQQNQINDENSNDSNNNDSTDSLSNQNNNSGQQTSQESTDNNQKNDEKNQSSNSSSNQSSSDNESQNKNDENNDVGHDTHSMWDKAIEKKKQDENSKNDSDNKEKDTEKSEATKEMTKVSEKDAFNQNKVERKKQLEELRKSLASQSHGYGSDTNSEIRTIDDIGTSEPLIDWRRLLKEAVKYDLDWSFQNAGIEDGIVTPYLEEQPRPETEILLDTSGSIDESLLRNFLRECKNILKTSKVKVGCFDTKFYGFTEIKDVSDIDNITFQGGGGTNFGAAINAFTRRVENKIIFTDGDAAMPKTPMDAIWIVFGERKIDPIGGKVIYIDENQLSEFDDFDDLYDYNIERNRIGRFK